MRSGENDHVNRAPARPLRVLLVGGSGFIGRRLDQALRDAGCEVTVAARRAAPGVLQVNLATDVRVEQWLPRVADIDVVINAAGAFVERVGNALDALHTAGPAALFEAAAQQGVRRAIQISALGAESGATRYFASKQAADRRLMELPVESVILRPSLVFGPGGGSASVMLCVATMPLLVVPRLFSRPVQPVHIDDLAAAVVLLTMRPAVDMHAPLAVVGARACSMLEFLQLLRRQLGLAPARVMQVPDALVRLGGSLPPLARTGLLGPDAMKMLAAGSTADPAGLASLLGRPPRDPGEFISRDLAPALGAAATLDWTLPLLRWSIALLWLLSGLFSLGIYPLEQSLALLAQVGIPARLQPLLLYGASAMDIALGIAVLAAGHRAVLWRMQIGLVLVYTVVITIWLPAFWLHPFGPITKNIPLLAAFYMLQRLEARRWNT